ncbi:MAG: hypothetical protein UZ12_BCD005000484 [Bacteroidetes bacterium OLB12]|nr:MAG: hypothetical protein UZ12_BCD005000484 [Bacteroidetes bacterium OLB12]
MVGLVPVVRAVVNPASLYQVYVLLPPGAVTKGAVSTSPTQYVAGANVMAGAAGVAFTINVILEGALSHPLPLISVIKIVCTAGAALLKPNAALEGLVPVVNGIVSAASAYQV